MSKTLNSKKPSDKMQKDIEDDEKELNLIKEVIEKGNLKAIESFPINLPKGNKNITKTRIPKKLSQNEIKKREERKKLKEIENLENIQNKLFSQRKAKRNLIEPLKHKPSVGEFAYENKLLKECRQMFSNNANNNSNNSNSNRPPSTANKTQQPIVKQHTSTSSTQYNNKNKNNNTVQPFPNTNKPTQDDAPSSALTAMKRTFTKQKIEIECDLDKQKDEEYINALSNDEISFYQNQTKDLYEFLLSIGLLRYIENFIKEGYDMIEDILNLPEDYFNNQDKPFLTKQQQQKLYENIKELKSKSEVKQPIKSKPQHKPNSALNRTFSDFGLNTRVNKVLFERIEICVCWICYKPLDRNDAIIRAINEEYNNEDIGVDEKCFCSEKCVKVFENKQQNMLICFQCEKRFDMTNGFVIYEGQKFCSRKCKQEYIESVSTSSQMKVKEEQQNENEINNNNNNVDDGECSDYEGDYYDPMEDF